MLQTVIETPEFITQSKTCMDTATRIDFINYIAANPLAGDGALQNHQANCKVTQGE